MRRYLLALLLVVSASKVTFAVNVDSLWQVWNDPQAADTVRIKALLTLVKKVHMHRDPDSAFVLAGLVLELAERAGSKRYMASALTVQAITRAMVFDHDAAVALNMRALALKEDLGDLDGQAVTLNNLAIIAQNRGDYATAERHLLQALRIRLQMRTYDMAAAVFSNLSICERVAGDLDASLKYCEAARNLAKAFGDTMALSDIEANFGITYTLRGEYPAALSSFQRMEALKGSLSDSLGMASARMNMAEVHMRHGDHVRAIADLKVALRLSERIGSGQSIANAHLNLGNVHHEMKDHDQALFHYAKAMEVMRGMDYPDGLVAIALNMGAEHELKGDLVQARSSYEQALELTRRIGDVNREGVALNNIAIIQRKQGDPRGALISARRALSIAQSNGSATDLRDVTKVLYEIHTDLGNKAEALANFERHVALRDSILSEENRAEVMRTTMQYEYDKQAALDSVAFAAEARVKDAEIDKQRADLSRQRIALGAIGGGLILLVALAWSIHRGKQRSDRLLLNILPYETAQELKAKGSAEARQFDEVTVLFTDFKGFTQLSQSLPPKELVAMINECFSAFDRIMEKHGIEKIKTIGDAYMAAAGLPVENTTNALDVVRAALDIQATMHTLRDTRQRAGLPSFEIRIGVHTGPVVAGIVGIKKFQYDIWGDTVNTASRMESSGEAGRVNISEATYRQVEHAFHCTPRGEVEAKGKGRMRMYFVEGPRTA